MIPVSLSIKGLYSYQKEQHIDFGRLVDAQLFGIFGSVGSGKSSILEAISFALYGETERLNKTDVRGYNMMNLKSDELYIDFIFRNHDDQSYRFVVRGKRNSRQFEKVNTLERNAYVLDGESWVPLERNSAEPILGLSYDNFRRTIIIPQGKFQEFLQLKEKDRTDMLKEIFQLERFDFFARTASLDKKSQESYLGIQGNLKSYEDLNEAGILLQQQKVSDLKLEHQQQEKALEILKQRFGGMEEQRKIANDFQQASNTLSEVEKQSDHYKIVEEKVRKYDYCRTNFAGIFQKEDLLHRELAKRENDHQIKSNAFVELNKLLKDNELKLEEVISYNAKNDDFLQQIADLEKLKQIDVLRSDVDQITARIAEGKKHVESVTAQKVSSEQLVKKIRDSIAMQQRALPDTLLLAEVKQWHLGLQSLEEQQKHQREQLSLNEEQWKTALLKFDDFKAQHGIPVDLDVDEALDWLNEQIAVLKRESEKLSAQLKHVEWQVQMANFANAIHDGEACPLCGSLDHPAILEPAEVHDKEAGIVSELKTAASNVEKWHEHSKTLSEVKFQIKNFKTLYDNQLSLVTSFATKLDQHHQLFVWDQFRALSLSDLEKSIQEVKQVQNNIREAELSLAQENELLEKSRANLERFVLKVTSLEKEEAEMNFGINQFKSQLKFISYSDTIDYNIDDKIKELKGKVEYNQSELKRMQELVHSQRTESVRLAEQVQALNNRIIEDRGALSDIANELDILFAHADAEMKSREGVKAILAQALDSEQLRREITQYQQKLYKAKEDWLRLQEKMAKVDFSEENYIALKAEKEDSEAKCKALHQSLIEADLMLNNQQRDWQLKRSLEKQADALRLRLEELSVLKNMFKSNGFVSYISTVYLNNLCDLANERFYPLSGQQLRLEVDDKNNFEVRDFLNEGRLRSVKTLSGGQTFQASLSLALALAESVQQQNKAKQNFFFLDEGFGSLDKESLLKAFDTLKSLRKENRVVGVISHVEELQQEIDVYLKIENDPMTGTRILAR